MPYRCICIASIRPVSYTHLAMWPGISADEDPSLRERALSETLFDWFCPECGYSARFLYPCLYSDRTHGFMVYLLPEGSPQEPVEMGDELASLADVKKRIVSTCLFYTSRCV